VPCCGVECHRDCTHSGARLQAQPGRVLCLPIHKGRLSWQCHVILPPKTSQSRSEKYTKNITKLERKIHQKHHKAGAKNTPKTSQSWSEKYTKNQGIMWHRAFIISHPDDPDKPAKPRGLVGSSVQSCEPRAGCAVDGSANERTNQPASCAALSSGTIAGQVQSLVQYQC